VTRRRRPGDTRRRTGDTRWRGELISNLPLGKSDVTKPKVEQELVRKVLIK
jgi:hypothetical protein